ncbi:septal ring lytic transglycosylase RlpA family protein [Nodosilinea sp. E11]|uniref:septal ring lytic transglycosylase RlpA family protein n=1 Tax=Nodosilinea sp. E11 TaxID=3037479 RepID=UPI0029349C4B|nr:septal ring lytic transglycosylase RlpA family protein [Nodosilinea sp. E11]WOD37961.1 septal ring lytic transglycosylase RlpA family protein [Nodosilinea sp. E11]
MKHSVLGGLTVAVAMSVFGAPLPSQAQEASDSAASIDAEHHADSLSHTLQTDTGLLTAADLSSPEPADPESPVSTQPVEDSHDALDLATVYPHALDARQAATVYIRSIPVITFVGDELETLSASSTPASLATDHEAPLKRANQTLARLQELAVDGDAADIKARWDSDDKAFVVTWGDEEIFALNDQIILPDTTENPGEDALHITNRLRRLLGDAPPLARVEGLPQPAPESRVAVVSSTLSGMASWYGPGFHGRRSASGEVFDQNAMTAAHRTLPFGTQVRVTNLSTGQSVVVRINDRGPFSHGRVIDLSAAAAGQIGLRASGVGRVQLEVLSGQ